MSSSANSGKTTNVSDNAFESVTATQQEAMESLMEMTQAIFKGLVEFNWEMTNFFAGRVVTDLELQQRALACKSVEDVMTLQGNFVETALSQYSMEAQKLASIGADVVKEDLDTIARQVTPLTRNNGARKQAA